MPIGEFVAVLGCAAHGENLDVPSLLARRHRHRAYGKRATLGPLGICTEDESALNGLCF
ncbi:MAG: hypothetical protein ABJH85_00060 [Paracoccaceae bacterium]